MSEIAGVCSCHLRLTRQRRAGYTRLQHHCGHGSVERVVSLPIPNVVELPLHTVEGRRHVYSTYRWGGEIFQTPVTHRRAEYSARRAIVSIARRKS